MMPLCSLRTQLLRVVGQAVLSDNGRSLNSVKQGQNSTDGMIRQRRHTQLVLL